ncbi:MAG: hypothetical protein RSD76_00460 [Clostridia bacterium]
MKPRLSIGVCVLISLALVIFGLLFGTAKGYEDDRAQAVVLLEGENGLLDALSYRAADGLNLCVVAKRHMAGDADVAALETVAKRLQDGRGLLAQKKQADGELKAAMEAVVTKLQANQSFQNSERDQKYVNMLSTDFGNLSKSMPAEAYNAEAMNFNAQLQTPLIGDFAKLLGVKPCELYE